eukprot:COSAG02_NODE_26551_length_630_cov_1.393597_1_plen_147_part_01
MTADQEKISQSKKIVEGSIAADILDVQVGLILRNVNSKAVTGFAYMDAMKLIGSSWKSSPEMTLTFAKPELVDDSEEEDDDDVKETLELGGKSPGGRRWVDGAAIEEMSASVPLSNSTADGGKAEEPDAIEEKPRSPLTDSPDSNQE